MTIIAGQTTEAIVTIAEATGSTGYVTDVGEVDEMTTDSYAALSTEPQKTTTEEVINEITLPDETMFSTVVETTFPEAFVTQETQSEYVATTVASTTVVPEITVVTETELPSVTIPGGATEFTTEGETTAGTAAATEYITSIVTEAEVVTDAAATGSTGRGADEAMQGGQLHAQCAFWACKRPVLHAQLYEMRHNFTRF